MNDMEKISAPLGRNGFSMVLQLCFSIYGILGRYQGCLVGDFEEFHTNVVVNADINLSYLFESLKSEEPLANN